MAEQGQVFCETPGVTVSGTTEAQRKSASRAAPEAELEGALKVIRAVSERITERMNEVRPRLQMLEQRLREAHDAGRPVDVRTCESLSHIREIADAVCSELQKFAH